MVFWKVFHYQKPAAKVSTWNKYLYKENVLTCVYGFLCFVLNLLWYSFGLDSYDFQQITNRSVKWGVCMPVWRNPLESFHCSREQGNRMITHVTSQWTIEAKSTNNKKNPTNPTMHQFHIPQCTILLQKCAHECTFLWKNGALWTLRDRPYNKARSIFIFLYALHFFKAEACPQKAESRHNTNLIITHGTWDCEIVVMTTYVASTDDKVGIVTTLDFLWHTRPIAVRIMV